MTLAPLHLEGRHFVDQNNRRVILRGLNLAGISIPSHPDGATHLKQEWPPQDLEHVSWVGRPFPESEFNEHFSRIKTWGFNCVRLLASWEAVEHAGPYQFDEEFIVYFTKLVRTAGEYGLYVFINFHQDVWSRVTGGDGHPLWLFDKVGLDYRKFDEADAAVNMQYLWDEQSSENRYPEQCWGENAKLFPARTMWTLFWGGSDFTPHLLIEDEISHEKNNVQHYMQNHFFAAIEKIMSPLATFPHVFGINPINEPSCGFIGFPMSTPLYNLKQNEFGLAGEPGLAWTPLDTMIAASGKSQKIPLLKLSLQRKLKIKKYVEKNSNCLSIWYSPDHDCWRNHNVWTKDPQSGQLTVNNEHYFQEVDGKSVDFTRDYLLPFHLAVERRMNSLNPYWMICIENDPALNGSIRFMNWPTNLPNNYIDAFHWYDLIQLGIKRFLWPIHFDLTRMRPVLGLKRIQRMYQNQLNEHIQMGEQFRQKGFNLGYLVGEFGIAMDMHHGRAYKNWMKKGNRAFNWHSKIMDVMYNAFDALLLSGAHWNYSSHNRNIFGDMWNLEDLSIFSQDQLSTNQNYRIYPEEMRGSRGSKGFCRPYAQFIAGIPSHMSFNQRKGIFTLQYSPLPQISEPSIIFIPPWQFPNGYHISCQGCDVERSKDSAYLFLQNHFSKRVNLKITKFK